MTLLADDGSSPGAPVSIRIDGERFDFDDGTDLEVVLLGGSGFGTEHEALITYEGRTNLDADAWSADRTQASSVTIASIAVDLGCRIAPARLRRYSIDIDGNSIVEGFGTRTQEAGFASMGFALSLGQHLDAEVSARGWSANGYSFGGRGNAPSWPQMLEEDWSGQPRRFPDLLDALIVFEADNEGVSEIGILENRVADGIGTALRRTGHATKIILCGPFISTAAIFLPNAHKEPAIADAVRRAVSRAGSSRVHYLDVVDLFDRAQTLDGVHPNAHQSMYVLAPGLAKRIAPLLGPPLERRGPGEPLGLGRADQAMAVIAGQEPLRLGSVS